ncbi:hypothetical protein [Calidifontibacillus erzurumensis]
MGSAKDLLMTNFNEKLGKEKRLGKRQGFYREQYSMKNREKKNAPVKR